MARVDPRELMTNREKYPDDMEITLAGGDTISLKEYRDGVMPKADFTRESERWSRRERELQGGLDAAQQNLSLAVRQAQEAAAALAARGQLPPATAGNGEISEDDLLRDNVLGPMYRQVLEGRKAVAAQQQRLDAHEKRLAQHETTWMRRDFTATIQRLKQQDPDLNVDEFLAFSQKHPAVDVESQQVDIEKTYRVYAYDRAVDRARKEGEAEGVKRGEATRVPNVPFGRRRTPVKPEGLPESFQAVTEEDILKDPDVQNAMVGDDQQG